MQWLKTETRPTTRRFAVARLVTLGLFGTTLAASKSEAEQVAPSGPDDQSAIANLLVSYATALDEGRIEDCAELFVGAQFTIENVATVRGSQGVMELFSGMILYDDGTPRTKHVVTNIEIAIGDDRRSAAAKSYLTVFQQVGETPLQPIFSGVYDDQFEKSDGIWRFSDRIVSASLFGDMSRHLRNPPN